MQREDVNELILQKVDEIDDNQVRNFVEDILRFERAELDKQQPHYKSDFSDYLQRYIEDWESYDQDN
jgi:hypothetical protein